MQKIKKSLRIKILTGIASILSIGLVLAGCDGFSGSGGDSGFMTSLENCGVAYSQCMNACKEGPTVCANRCEKTRGMCRSMRQRGCMQACNDNFAHLGKNSPAVMSCKEDCRNKRFE